MSDGETRTYTCSSDDHPDVSAGEIEARRGSDAAKEWVDRWWGVLGAPEEVRVRVRRDDGKVRLYDVHIEEVMLDLSVMPVPVDGQGNPLSYEQLCERAEAAMRGTVEHG